MMQVREEFAELPLGVQLTMKAFGVGIVLGAFIALVNLASYLRAAEGMRGEVLELGAYWVLLLGFPLSVALAPLLMSAPWVGMILIPALNLAVLTVVALVIYRAIRLLPPSRE